MPPSLGMVALWSKCLVGLSGTFSLITWGRCSRNVPFVCVCVCVFVVVVS